ncbi:MAG: NADH-quinone oxidoreductase subunit N [Anaerolineaceae bacterium]|nr:NADH-quinone oxidoreductase subunit N [Anaerolineaceae bacterium]
MTIIDLFSILPVLVLVVWALFLLLADLWASRKLPGLTPILAVVGLVCSLVVSIVQVGKPQSSFGGMIHVDGFSVFLNILFAITGIAAVALAYESFKNLKIQRGEYYVLLLFSLSGMMLMGAAGDLIVIFLALELLSIPLYIMAGMDFNRLESKEASLKYLLLGTFASAIVLFGTAFIYGAAQTTNLYEIALAVNLAEINWTLFIIGAALLVVGFGFKVAAVPFHTWTPDVYHGAPSSVTAFMAVGAKAAGFAALIRVFSLDFTVLSENLTAVFWALAVLTMIVGNFTALAQKNLKRMLAYSSIAHAGYILMAFVAFGNEAVRADSIASALFYLAAYAATSIGAWAVLIAVEREDASRNEIEHLAGLGKTAPLLAAAMTVFMLSFTGIPVTLGFWGKFYLFRTAIQGGNIILAVIGLLTSLVSAYYYLRVVVKMYFQEGDVKVSQKGWSLVVAVVAALIVLGLAFIPELLYKFAASSLIIG